MGLNLTTLKPLKCLPNIRKMNNKQFILAALLLGATSGVYAQQIYTGSSVETVQESAIKLVADGHYYAAKLALERYLSGAGRDKKLVKDAYAGQKVVLIENEFGEIGMLFIVATTIRRRVFSTTS